MAGVENRGPSSTPSANNSRQRATPFGVRATPLVTPLTRASAASRPSARSTLLRTNQNTSAQTKPTPSSRDPLQSATTHEASWVGAMVENREHEVGFVLYNIRSAELKIYHYLDTDTCVHTLSLTMFYKPAEILLPDTMENTKLHRLLSEDGLRVVPIRRKYFNDVVGLQLVLKIASMDDHSEMKSILEGKYLACACAAALIQYIEYVQSFVFAANSCNVTFCNIKDQVHIDPSTIVNLELVRNTRSTKLGSLLSLFNPITRGGSRLMRSCILQPSLNIKRLQDMHLAIASLLRKLIVIERCKKILYSCGDLDLVATSMANVLKTQDFRSCQLYLKQMIILKQTMEASAQLAEALTENYGPEDKPFLLDVITVSLQRRELSRIQEEIVQVIDEECATTKSANMMETQMVFSVKPGIDPYLDIARKIYTDTVEDVYKSAESYSEDLQRDIRVHYTAKRGYHLLIPMQRGEEAESLPSAFIQVSQVGNKVFCSTGEIVSMNERIKETVKEIYAKSADVLSILISRVREYAAAFYKCADNVSLLDTIIAMCEFIQKGGGLEAFCIPDYNSDGPIAIKNGRNPVIDFRSMEGGGDRSIGNDLYCNHGAVILRGPNMAGKTTTLKTVCLLTILAHTGCLVPAEFASFPKVTRIMSRLGTSDSIEQNASSFMLEMRECAWIIRNADKESLIVLDEVGRGTGDEDGFGIAWATCEKLVEAKSFTFFTTHYDELHHLSLLYPGGPLEFQAVSLFRLASVREGTRLRHRYKLQTEEESDNTAEEYNYGIETARIAGFPQDVVAKALSIAGENVNRITHNHREFIENEVNKEKRAIVSSIVGLACYSIQKSQSSEIVNALVSLQSRAKQLT